jgi:hypothetical protein
MEGNIDWDTKYLIGVINGFLRDYGNAIKYVKKREKIYSITKDYIRGKYDDKDNIIYGLHRRIGNKFSESPGFSQITGLAFINDFGSLGIRPTKIYGGPNFQIQNLRLVSRVGPGNSQVNQVVFSLLQTSAVKIVDDKPEFFRFKPIPRKNTDEQIREAVPDDYTELKGGCTLIFDLDSLKLRYAVSKPLLDVDQFTSPPGRPAINLTRLKRLLDFRQKSGESAFAAYFSDPSQRIMEPFAFLHQH